MTFTKTIKLSDITPGRGKAIKVGEISIAVFNVGGDFFAIDETCPHKGGPLAEGWIQDLTVRCPWHGAIFSLETGKGIAGPCGSGVLCYNTRIGETDLEVDIDDA